MIPREEAVSDVSQDALKLHLSAEANQSVARVLFFRYWFCSLSAV